MARSSFHGLCQKIISNNRLRCEKLLLNRGKTHNISPFMSTYNRDLKLIKKPLNFIVKRHHETISAPQTLDQTVKITYIGRDGEKHEIKGKVGDNVMYLAQHNDLDVEGACEASLACCTCHVYVEGDFFDKLGDLDEEEEDMLDLAPFLQENSRLSCQIILSKDLDGIVVRLPSATRNFYVDGHKPQPH